MYTGGRSAMPLAQSHLIKGGERTTYIQTILYIFKKSTTVLKAEDSIRTLRLELLPSAIEFGQEIRSEMNSTW